jgi:hypothetical protein
MSGLSGITVMTKPSSLLPYSQQNGWPEDGDGDGRSGYCWFYILVRVLGDTQMGEP